MKGQQGGINIERNDCIISNVELPCAVLDNYNININDKYVSVGRIFVLVVPDNCDNDVTHLSVTINTNGDWTKNNDVDMTYDKIIMGGNPEHYYYGTMGKTNFYGYNTNDSLMMYVRKNEKC